MKLFDNCNISSTHVDMNVKQQPAFITSLIYECSIILRNGSEYIRDR